MMAPRWGTVPCFLLFLACERPPPPTAGRPYPEPQLAATGEVVAKIGEVAIRGDELGKRLAGQGPVAIDRMNDAARKKQFLEEQVRFELLAREAWAQGLHEHPDVIMELKKAMVQRYLRTTFADKVDAAPISDAELATMYQASHDEFNKPGTVRLSQIVRRAKNDAERKKAHALLTRAKAEILTAEKQNKPTAFAEAARVHSEDEDTKTGGGELQFMDRAELERKYGPDVARVMFDELKVGDMAIADASDAVVLFKKTGLRNPVARTLEMVKPQLRARIQSERRNKAFEALFAELEKKHGVVYDLEALARVQLGSQATRTATTP